MKTQEELRKIAIHFAKETGIPYDRVSIRKSKFATFKVDGESSGGWHESGTSLTVPLWIIRKYLDKCDSLAKQREELEAKHKESYETVIGSPVELRGDIDDELREYVPDIENHSVDGISPSFTFLYTRAIINSVQEAQRKRAAQLTKSKKNQ